MDTLLKNSIILLCSTIILFGCKKPEERKCIKSAGDDTEIIVQTEDFNKLYLGPHIKFVLVQDTLNYVILRGGKNLLPFIEFTYEDGQLGITNSNKCNFLRSYKHEVEAEIHFNSIYNIKFDGTKELTCPKQINSSYFTLTMIESAGKVNLNLNADLLHLSVERNWGNFDLRGNVNFLRMAIQGSGFGTTENLQVQDSIHVISKSNENVSINADGVYLRAQTHKDGNIYYIGYPNSIEYDKIGNGELIDNN